MVRCHFLASFNYFSLMYIAPHFRNENEDKLTEFMSEPMEITQ